MPPNDLDAAQVVADLYWHPEKLDSVIEVSGVCLGTRNFDDVTIICFRGSTTFLDWRRDFENGAQMIYDQQLGGVHPGFLVGIRDALLRIEVKESVNPIWIVGHSLGAGRALICAGLLAAEGLLLPADQIVTFGSPRPGGQKLKNILADVPIRSYKNRCDPITDVPFDIPYIDPYVHPRDLIQVDVAPPELDSWIQFADHHDDLYLKAMQNAFGANTTVS